MFIDPEGIRTRDNLQRIFRTALKEVVSPVASGTWDVDIQGSVTEVSFTLREAKQDGEKRLEQVVEALQQYVRNNIDVQVDPSHAGRVLLKGETFDYIKLVNKSRASRQADPIKLRPILRKYLEKREAHA